MLDCCNSPLLPTAACLGWKVSGIGSDKRWIDVFKRFCKKNNFKYEHLIYGDLRNYNCDVLKEQYNLLISSGLFLHASSEILEKWCTLLIKDGVVFNGVPNCHGINGKFLKKFDTAKWQQLIHHTPESFDKLHIDAGLKVKLSAYYGRGIDVDMLVPWGEIRNRFRLPFAFKIFRYSAYFGSKIIAPFVSPGSKTLNSFLYGMYYK